MKQNRHLFSDRVWKWSEAVVTDPDPPPPPQCGKSRPPAHHLPSFPSLSHFPFSETKPSYRDHPGASAMQPGPATSRSWHGTLHLPPAALGSSLVLRPRAALTPTFQPYVGGGPGREGRAQAQASVADLRFPAESCCWPRPSATSPTASLKCVVTSAPARSV